ncbi:CD151 antigen-like isoform X2 [Apostichopus japonicus]
MGYKYDDEPCCGISLLKYVLFIFNFFLLLAGAGVLAIGIWTLISKTDYTELLCSNIYYFSVIVLIIAGGLIMILAATGCYGAVMEVKGCLLLYFSLLLLLCIIELGLSIFLYIFRAQLQVELESCLNDTLSVHYGKEDKKAFTENFDELQRSFKCCGSVDYRDWKTSFWNSSGLAKNRTTPDSCCKSETNFCAARDHPSNIYHYGCVEGLRVYLADSLVIVMVVFLGIGLIEMIGLIFTMCLYCHLRYENEDL